MYPKCLDIAFSISPRWVVQYPLLARGLFATERDVLPIARRLQRDLPNGGKAGSWSNTDSLAIRSAVTTVG